MTSLEKINIPQESPESKEPPAKEKWKNQVSDFLKKFWFASLLVAVPSIAEAKEPVKFEDVWRVLTSGRDNPADLSLTITKRSSNREENARYLRAYRTHNARMDSILKIVPIKEIGEYLESFGFDFNSVTSFQKEFRFLPVHNTRSSIYASVISFKDRAKSGVIEINTAKMSPRDTALVEMISVHEIGHLIRMKKFKDLNLKAGVIEEGLTNWGAWKFMKDRLSKQGLSNQEIKTRLKPSLETGYNGETLLAAMLDYLNKDKNLLKKYYNGADDFPVYEDIEWSHERLTRIIRRDIYTDGPLNSYEIINLLQYLIAEYGRRKVRDVYQTLESDYFIDITQKNIGALKWDGNITYLDTTVNHPPYSTEGWLYLLTPNNMIVNLVYDINGMRQYEDIIFQLQEAVRTPGINFMRMAVHPSISLKELDGSLRKEIKNTLEPPPQLTGK